MPKFDKMLMDMDMVSLFSDYFWVFFLILRLFNDIISTAKFL
jgi:hypothetical protein